MKSSLAVIILFVTNVLGSDPLVVKTKAGKVRGYRKTSRAGRQFLAFDGVPYAKPPVGPLRFEPPVELERWAGIKNATEPGPLCLQYNTFEINPVPLGVEDCLYLSVYTHKKRSRNPVLIHFHGGGFTSGNGARKTQPDYLMDEDVVIVNVNYRVGFVGFLSFEDEEMPGNQGLKDQVMAMRWVQKNIAKFGGDPKSVTLIGESVGGVAVYHHIVSPITKGLFHRAIAESGTSYCARSLAAPGLARATAKELAKNLGCPSESTSAAVSCLKTKNGTEVITAIEAFRVFQVDIRTIWPALEPDVPGAFFPGPVSKWRNKPVPLLMGTTSAEGLFRTKHFVSENTDLQWFNDNFARLAPVSLQYFASASDPDKVTEEIRDYYFEDGNITSDSWFNLTQMYTDGWYAIGIIDGANLHTGDTYFYYFDYIGEHTFTPGTNCTLFFGAPHVEESNFIWKNPNVNWTLEGEDLDLSKRLVKIWTDFAKSGTPAPKGSNLTWSKWNPEIHNYLEMSHEGFSEKEGFARDRYDFWKSINYRDNF